VELNIFATAEETASAVARRVAESLRERPDLVLGLPAGRTPIAVYADLRQAHASTNLDFSRATVFTVDEFAGIDKSHPGSFHRFIDEHLLSSVGIDAARIHSLNGAAADLDAECVRYEEALARAGGVGLQLLGIGTNGHIGFNEPGESLIAPTHRVTLLETTRQENAALFGGDPTRVPREALTMGIGTILRAEAVLLMASGRRKAPSIERMIRGPMTTHVPASFLQAHRRVEVYLDRDAAARL
jgi:glucosamine-6-phosphate deaminase